jgi:ABC-type bacteriocin/lantibiotic exporter with double-glycine peptidase domain
MPRTLPLLKQEREDSCAIACLRMVLAGRGTMVTERELVLRAQMEEVGVDLEELERLARNLGLIATAWEARRGRSESICVRGVMSSPTSIVPSST